MARNHEIRIRVSEETKVEWNRLVGEIYRRYPREIRYMEDVVKKIIRLAWRSLEDVAMLAD